MRQQVIDVDLISSGTESDDSDIEVVKSLTRAKPKEPVHVDLSLDTPCSTSRVSQVRPGTSSLSSSATKHKRSSKLRIYDSDEDNLAANAAIVRPPQILPVTLASKAQPNSNTVEKGTRNSEAKAQIKEPSVASAILSTEQVVLTPYARKTAVKRKRNYVDLSIEDSEDDMDIDTSIASPSQLLPAVRTPKPQQTSSRGQKNKNVVDLSIDSDEDMQINTSAASPSQIDVPVASTSRVTLDAPVSEEHRLAGVEAENFGQLVKAMADGKPEVTQLYLLSEG